MKRAINEKQQISRNYGVDLLRIISMIMICILHILSHGGVVRNLETDSINYWLTGLLQIMAYCGVNCFALISGYVGYEAKFRYANILYLNLQVMFYTVIITLVFGILVPDSLGIQTMLQAFLPLAYTYWFFTAYFCMFFFIPFLNILVHKANKVLLQKLLIALMLVFSILPTLFHSDMGRTSYGYSTLWLAIMYIMGACIKKYDAIISCKKCIVGYAGCVLISWFAKLGIEFLTYNVLGEVRGGNYLIAYTSPTIVLCAVFLLLFFKSITLGRTMVWVVKNFAPVSFGVYLIHEHPLIRTYIINNAFSWCVEANPIVLLTMVMGSAIAIWFICSMIDKIRLILFERLKLKQGCVMLEDYIRLLISNIVEEVSHRKYNKQ